MIKIINVHEYTGGIEKAVEYIHGIWGNAKSLAYYQDAIRHSFDGGRLPQFYLLMRSETAIGCAALITNDFISRHDLYPWMACLFVAESERGHEYGNLLMTHAEKQAKAAGFSSIYLTTDHDGYYEKYDWKRIEDGIDLFTGQPSRIYRKDL